jgi:hypothetical protein
VVWILAQGAWDDAGTWDDADFWRDGPAAVVLEPWLLLTGYWNDEGYWDDTAHWKDGPTVIDLGWEMLTPTFDRVPNSATWEVRCQFVDTATDEPYDLTGSPDDIVVTIRDAYTKTNLLTGNFVSGEVFLLPGVDGGFAWRFTDDQMGTLCPKTYEIGVRFEFDLESEVAQVILGRLHVIAGL